MQLDIGGLFVLKDAVFISDEKVKAFSSYREAVIWSWKNRRQGYGMNDKTLQSWICSNFGYIPSHFSRSVNEFTASPMDLKADFIGTFESITGNRAITQYLARITQTTSLEEIQAIRAAA